jgi:hypothetical protein
VYRKFSTQYRAEVGRRNSLQSALRLTVDGAPWRASTVSLSASFSPHAEVQGKRMEIIHLNFDTQVNLHVVASFSTALIWVLFRRGRRGR